MASGMSGGQMFGAVIGAAAGFFFPPASLLAAGMTEAGIAALGASIGMTIGGIIDPPPQQTIHQEGPRLGDLTVQTSEWGTPIRRLFGTYRLTGNIIWSLDLHETKHVEESGEGKGGGGGTKTETTWYSYAGTWAVGLCEGEVAGIKKIWFDSVLVYDNSNYAGGLSRDNHTIYKGTLDQEINWLMQSDNEVTPAYRGLCYIVFDSIELENYGNKIPRVSCEVVKSGAYLQKTINEPTAQKISQGATAYYTYDGGAFFATSKLGGATISLYKTFYDKAVYTTDLPYTVTNVYYTQSSEPFFIEYSNRVLLNGRYLHFASYYLNDFSNRLSFTTDGYPIDCISYQHNNVLYSISKSSISQESIIFYRNLVGSNIDSLSCPGNWPASGECWEEKLPIVKVIEVLADLKYKTIYIYEELLYILTTNNTIEVFTLEGIYVSEILLDQSIDVFNVSNYKTDVSFKIFNGFIYISYGYLVQIVSFSGDLIGVLYPQVPINIDSGSYIEISNSAVTHRFTNIFVNSVLQDGLAFERFSLTLNENQVSLASICEELFTRAGLTDFDVSEGNSELVDGYVIPNPMTTRAAISSIISAYGYELIETGFKIKLKKRNPNSVTGTISNIIDFVEIERRQTAELSRQVNISYANKAKNYDAGIQSAIRVDSDAKSTKGYQFALSLTDSKAKQIAEKFLYSEWSERAEFKFSLPLEYMYLEPSDTITIESKGDIFDVRLTKIDYASNGQLNCEASLEDSTVYISNAIGSDTGSAIQEVQLTGPTNLELLDIPMLDNTYNTEGVYVAASGYLNGWPGCNIDKSTDQEVTYNSVGSIIDKTIIGIAATQLQDGITTTVDLVNTVVVSLIDPIYDSSIEDLFNASNYILIGNEVLQYQYAQDNGDNTYTLSNLLRGRRGTEWATNTHSIGERFVLLDNNMLFDSTTALNVDSYYKATTFGDFLEDSTAEYIVPEIRCLKPLAVSRVYGTRDGSNNLTINWMRRSRDVTGYMKTLQLFEETESYEVDIITGTGRTLTSTSESVVYTANDQITDGISLGDPITIEIYQISGVVGRGYASQETV
ncbi:MAG: hypothetical protein GY707_05215 [Desulfobacteraceae bacterium]|nr:hypothetical protein [Desulfobacteraceae bacterium]